MTRIPMTSETLAETLHARNAGSARLVPRHRRVLAGLMAGALAISVVLASTMPVRADDNRDLVKALAAIAVIGVIANEIGRDREVKKVEHRDRDWRPLRPDAHHAHPRIPQHPEPKRSLRLPAACAIEIEARDRRNAVVYTESCLRDYGVGRLPSHCAREIRFYGRHDRVYSEFCLREAGFRGDKPERRIHERPD